MQKPRETKNLPRWSQSFWRLDFSSASFCPDIQVEQERGAGTLRALRLTHWINSTLLLMSKRSFCREFLWLWQFGERKEESCPKLNKLLPNSWATASNTLQAGKETLGRIVSKYENKRGKGIYGREITEDTLEITSSAGIKIKNEGKGWNLLQREAEARQSLRAQELHQSQWPIIRLEQMRIK